MESLLFAAVAAGRNLFPLIAAGAFFLALLALAAWGMKRTSTTTDFFLGGRTLGPWILALSYGAAYFSAVVFIGFSGVFGWGISFESMWIGIMNGVLGSLIAWLVLGKPTRKMTRRLNASTTPEFFAARYGSNFMKIVGAISIFFFLLPYSAAVFSGLSYLFEQVFGIEWWVALLIITIATGVYLIVGGYKAAARIDFLQGLIMFFGTLFMVAFVLKYFGGQYGGVGAALARAAALFKERAASGIVDPALVDSNGVAIPFKAMPEWLFWAGVVMTSLAPWGLPQMVHKFYAIKDEKQIVKGAVICFLFATLVGAAAYFMGALAHLLTPETLAETATPDKTALNVNQLVPVMLVKALPQWFLAVILLLVLSASMSTLCALALTSSAALSLDLYKGFVAPNASEKRQLGVFRFFCAVFIVCSFFIALKSPSWIVALTALSWAAICGGFLAPYVYGLFWRGATKGGAIAGMIAGLLVANGAYWGLFFGVNPGAAKTYSAVIATCAMLFPFLVVPVVSVMTKKLEPERVRRAFEDAIEDGSSNDSNSKDA